MPFIEIENGETQVPNCKLQEQRDKQDTTISGSSFRMCRPLKSMAECVAGVIL